MATQTCLENLNQALTLLATNDEKILFIGEDIKDPYGGAFKAEKGLSCLFPNRVISTPISEESFTGFAAGLAMRGYKPIADYMFSDFMTLSLDPVINFISKYPQMYGRELPLSVILRCANGGYRGYGATHSQSMQKIFMGIAHVFVFEMSPFHDNQKVFERMLNQHKACIFFEEKTIYNAKMFMPLRNDIFTLSYCGKDGNWACLSVDNSYSETVVLCPGGMSKIVQEAAAALLLEHEICANILTPSQLYPCELTPIMDRLKAAKKILVVEQSAPGATWGSCVLETLSRTPQGREIMPHVRLVSSQDGIIPANPRLEREALVGAQDIVHAAQQ